MSRDVTTRNLGLFLIGSCLLFWLMLGATGVLLALKVPPTVAQVIKNVDAWAPTIVVLLFFRRLYPGVRLGDHLKRLFTARVGAGAFLASFGLQALAFLVALGIYCLYSGVAPASISWSSISALLPVVVVTLTSGPLGEELGWRGYAYGELRKRRSPLASALLLGLVWGVWHLPLWLLSGYALQTLLIYIVSFMAAIVSTSILMGRFFEKSRNLFVPMWIHFWFNFLLKLVNVDVVAFLACLAVVYAVVATVLGLSMRRAGAPAALYAEPARRS